MGGVPKGLLRAPGSDASLVERLIVELRAGVPDAEVVLVGAAAPYGALGLEVVADEPPGIGPLGGLAGLLSRARRQDLRYAMALACDLPRLGREVLARLAVEAPDAGVVLVRQGEVRNPLIARFEVERASHAVERVVQQGRRSLQAVLNALEPDVTVLALSPEDEARLEDWDTPSEVRRGGG